MLTNEEKQELLKAIDGNNPAKISELLQLYFNRLSKESLKGFTPSVELSQYWRRCRAVVAKLKEVKQ